MIPARLDWDKVSKLHVIRRVGQLVRRRFGLALELRPEGATPPPEQLAKPGYDIEVPIEDDARRIGVVHATGDTPPAQEEFLQDLLAVAADEVVTYLREVLTREERLGELQQEVEPRYSYDNIIGKSPAMQELYRLLDKLADSETTVLIQGDNGTGKELISKAIHYNSRRARERFVIQNCSALNDNLLDSELFGHKKGAFTGAVSDKQGLFEVADRGTFFLDEIGDMSPSLQVKLLRVLQEGTFIPVGDTRSRHVDVRILAATNRNLRQMVDASEFREDLYYRVNVISLTVPPLRDRRADIPVLADHFLEKAARGKLPHKLSRESMGHLLEHDWPGNVRELENEMERLAVLAGSTRTIDAELLSPRIRTRASLRSAKDSTALPEAVESLERTMILDAMRRTGWNKTRAADELRISRRNLIRKVRKYHLTPGPS